MGFGIFKKIKDAFKKAAQWTRNNIIRPVVNTAKKIINSDTTKKIIDTGIKLAPAIATAAATSQGASPATGMAIGNSIQSIGHSLGYG